MKKLIYFLLLLCLYSCSSNNDITKYQKKRGNIIEVKNKIKEIDLNDVLLHENSVPYIFGKYFIVLDPYTTEKVINIFDKTTFKHLVSVGNHGQGPFEYVSAGGFADNHKGEFYLTDFGKYVINSYHIDSLINDSVYQPKEFRRIKESSFPSDYIIINDSITIAQLIHPTSISTFVEYTGIWNIKTGNISMLTDTIIQECHKKRFVLAVSPQDEIFAECNYLIDMICIYNFKGELLHKVFGPDIKKEHYLTFNDATFSNDYLFTLYQGGDYGSEMYDSKCIIFKKNGDYVATLHLGYNVIRFCYDQDNNRLIFWCNDEILCCYLDLNGIID
ncbi:MAG: hypothetical protein MJ211_03365 [Bacteroidales bacterium]|nr:hypothetical protein [Bacteroidales bacterium]